MGIKALDPADWILFGEDAEHQLTERRRLLDRQPADVLSALPGSEAAQDELLAVLLGYLERHAQGRYRIERDGVIETASGLRFPQHVASPPLELAGRLVQEDFCLLQREGDRYILTAAVLCFPAHWYLSEKIGRPLIDIHAPVPGFAEQLGAPVERLFERLDAEKPVQRLNWSLVNTDQLFLPPSHRREPVDLEPVDLEPDEIGTALRLRVERQTLRRLPDTKAVVFSIRTFVHPLDEVVDSAETADALMQRLLELPSPMQTYKNLEKVKPALVAYLKQRQGRGR